MREGGREERGSALVDGFHRGDLDGDTRLGRLQHLDSCLEVLHGQPAGQQLRVLAREHERTTLQERELCA